MAEETLERKERVKDNLSRIKHKLLVISGKGGVGKTTVAVNLAYGLADKGYKVGIMDIDFHGPNVAKMLGIEKEELKDFGEGIEPVKISENLKAISISLMGRDPDQPIIWRGPLKMVAVQQLLGDVNWGELDFLIIDSPPGTGDEPLNVCQVIEDLEGTVIITTPQDVAVMDSRKSIMFSRELGVPVLGLVENMSGFTCPYCKKKIDLFKEGGGKRAAEELNVLFLGVIPLTVEVSNSCDSGKPLIHFDKKNPASQAMSNILNRLLAEIIKKKEL